MPVAVALVRVSRRRCQEKAPLRVTLQALNFSVFWPALRSKLVQNIPRKLPPSWGAVHTFCQRVTGPLIDIETYHPPPPPSSLRHARFQKETVHFEPYHALKNQSKCTPPSHPPSTLVTRDIIYERPLTSDRVFE